MFGIAAFGEASHKFVSRMFAIQEPSLQLNHSISVFGVCVSYTLKTKQNMQSCNIVVLLSSIIVDIRFSIQVTIVSTHRTHCLNLFFCCSSHVCTSYTSFRRCYVLCERYSMLLPQRLSCVARGRETRVLICNFSVYYLCTMRCGVCVRIFRACAPHLSTAARGGLLSG